MSDDKGNMPQTPSSSSSQQVTGSHPPIKPGSNPNLPPHFALVSVWTWTDYYDPECYIYNEIEDQLDHIILDTRPDLGSSVIHLGTLRRKPGDDDYDPVIHPKVLAVEMDRQSIHRWQEVENQIRPLVNDAYARRSMKPPPIRYYLGGSSLCSPMPSTESGVSLFANPSLPKGGPHPTQQFVQRPGMGHSIGRQGDPISYGTMGFFVALEDDHSHRLPDVYGGTCHHVASNDPRAILKSRATRPNMTCAALPNIMFRVDALYNKIVNLQKEIQTIQSSRVNYPDKKICDWQPQDKRDINTPAGNGASTKSGHSEA
ncbi:MAG: hypothetical protein LQ337_002844 [Flavoplaca oasis]|nr:MAG: hypothetical protein LQ337_002844 [Flavoplaca oasis]